MNKSEVSFANGATAQAYWITKNFFVVNVPKEKKRNSFGEWRNVHGRPWGLYHAPSMLLTASLDTQKAAKQLVAELETESRLDWTSPDLPRLMFEFDLWGETKGKVGAAEHAACERVAVRDGRKR